MSAAYHPTSLPVRVLSCVGNCDRNARRSLAVGNRSFATRNPGHPLIAAHSDCLAVLCAAAYARHRHGPEPAEDDDVHAAALWVHVLLRLGRPCTILVNFERGYDCAAAHY